MTAKQKYYSNVLCDECEVLIHSCKVDELTYHEIIEENPQCNTESNTPNKMEHTAISYSTCSRCIERLQKDRNKEDDY